MKTFAILTPLQVFESVQREARAYLSIGGVVALDTLSRYVERPCVAPYWLLPAGTPPSHRVLR